MTAKRNKRAVRRIRLFVPLVLSVLSVRSSCAQERITLGLTTRNGIGPDEAMRNVIRLVRETRKNLPEVGIADVADWSFARKAQ